jgi:hypothetical protein
MDSKLPTADDDEVCKAEELEGDISIWEPRATALSGFDTPGAPPPAAGHWDLQRVSVSSRQRGAV